MPDVSDALLLMQTAKLRHAGVSTSTGSNSSSSQKQADVIQQQWVVIVRVPLGIVWSGWVHGLCW